MEKITGFILAGGKSTRMNEDKGLKLLLGKAIVQHVIDSLKPCVEEIVIVSNNEKYNQFGYKVIPDLVDDAGPLGGILTALSNSSTKFNFIVSCDMPFIYPEAILYLMNHLGEGDVSVPVVGGEMQPLFGVYTKSCLESLKNSIRDKKLKLISFIEKSRHTLMPMEESGLDMNLLFTNVNTPKDFEEALRALKNKPYR